MVKYNLHLKYCSFLCLLVFSSFSLLTTINPAAGYNYGIWCYPAFDYGEVYTRITESSESLTYVDKSDGYLAGSAKSNSYLHEAEVDLRIGDTFTTSSTAEASHLVSVNVYFEFLFFRYGWVKAWLEVRETDNDLVGSNKFVDFEAEELWDDLTVDGTFSLLVDLQAGTSYYVRCQVLLESYYGGGGSDAVLDFDEPDYSYVEYFRIQGTMSSGGGGGCIAKGTKILLADGEHWKLVQHLNIGDWVQGYNLTSGQTISAQVTKNEQSLVTSLLKIKFPFGILKTTLEDQPIYMRNTSYTGWLRNPKDLKEGEEIFHVPTSSWVEILSLSVIQGQFEVYEVVTDPLNTFIGNGILLDAKVP